jgi:hypothetical protein
MYGCNRLRVVIIKRLFLQTRGVHVWSGVKNGELLRRAHGVCEVFVTLDRNLEFQQNIKVLPFGVVVVRSISNRMADLAPHVSSILAAANRVIAGQVEKAGIQ